MTLDDLWGHTSSYEICVFIMLTFLKIFKGLGVEQIIICIAEKVDFEILGWPNVTFNDLWGHTSFYEKY